MYKYILYLEKECDFNVICHRAKELFSQCTCPVSLYPLQNKTEEKLNYFFHTRIHKLSKSVDLLR